MLNITEIELYYFNASKVKTMNILFYQSSNLEKNNFGSIDTLSVKDMGYLFELYSKLTSFDLSNFDSSKVKKMDWIFTQSSI